MVNIDQDLLKQMQDDLLEELHPDLEDYYDEDGVAGFPALRHPLVYSVPLFSNGQANRIYELKLKQTREARLQKKYERWVFLHERPYRLEAFGEICHNLKDTEYWGILGSIWTDTENQWQNLLVWKGALSSTRPFRHYLMDEKEDQALRSLPEFVTVYRGCVEKLNENGLSWTLSKEKAQWFAGRFTHKGEGKVLEKIVPKSEIIALFLGRNESEIVLEVKK